jgi:hypothetical protein
MGTTNWGNAGVVEEQDGGVGVKVVEGGGGYPGAGGGRATFVGVQLRFVLRRFCFFRHALREGREGGEG